MEETKIIREKCAGIMVGGPRNWERISTALHDYPDILKHGYTRLRGKVDYEMKKYVGNCIKFMFACGVIMV